MLPRVIPRIHRAYPDLKLDVRKDVPMHLLDGLDVGKYDVIIMPLPVRAEGLEAVLIFCEPLYLVVPADSQLSHRDHIERKELKGLSILTLEAGHLLREQVEMLCEEFGANLRT